MARWGSSPSPPTQEFGGPTHAPFWIKPDSTFGLFALTSLETDVHSRSTFRSPLELFPTELDRRVVGDSHRAESLRVCGLQDHCHGGKDAGPVIAGLEGSLDGGRSRRQFGPRGGRAVRGEREHRDPLGAAVACRG